MIRIALIAAASLVASSVLAALPDEMLDDPALEARASALDRELRCVVCQSQSISESNADLARDMRIILRERIAAGDSDKEVVDYLVARYGDYVLLRPRVQPNTYALWLFPAAILIVAAALGAGYVRHRRAPPPPALTPEEEKAVQALIDGGKS